MEKLHCEIQGDPMNQKLHSQASRASTDHWSRKLQLHALLFLSVGDQSTSTHKSSLIRTAAEEPKDAV